MIDGISHASWKMKVGWELKEAALHTVLVKGLGQQFVQVWSYQKTAKDVPSCIRLLPGLTGQLWKWWPNSCLVTTRCLRLKSVFFFSRKFFSECIKTSSEYMTSWISCHFGLRSGCRTKWEMNKSIGQCHWRISPCRGHRWICMEPFWFTGKDRQPAVLKWQCGVVIWGVLDVSIGLWTDINISLCKWPRMTAEMKLSS